MNGELYCYRNNDDNKIKEIVRRYELEINGRETGFKQVIIEGLHYLRPAEGNELQTQQ
jgi:hypothetical protein